MNSRMNIAFVRGKPHIYAAKDHASPRAEGAKISSWKIEPASACSNIRLGGQQTFSKLEQSFQAENSE